MPFLKRSNCHHDGVPVIEKICFMHKDTPIRSDHSFKRTQKDDMQSCNGPFKALGSGPSLYVAGDYLACHGKAYFCHPAHTKSADAVRSFQFRVRCLDPCTDLVPVLPCGCLLEGIHMIPQANLGGDLQTKIPDRITGLAASSAMVGSPHRTVIEHRTGPTKVTIEDRMEGAAVVLLPLSTRWSTGLCPSGHRVTRPSELK